MLWYVLERYVCVLLGRSHLISVANGDSSKNKSSDSIGSDEKKEDLENKDNTVIKDEKGEVKKNGDVSSGEKFPPGHIHLTYQELHGLKV